MTREQLDLLVALVAVAGGIVGLPLAILQLAKTALEVSEKLVRRRKKRRGRPRRVNLRRKDGEVG